jgi:hypothetical protein
MNDSEIARQITYYVHSDYIINYKTCNTSCFNIINDFPEVNICMDYCLIKIYIEYFLFLFKFWLVYKLSKNVYKNESWILATIYTILIYFI